MFNTHRTALGYALVAGLAVTGCGTAPPDPTETTGTLGSEQVVPPITGELPGLAPTGPFADWSTLPSLSPSSLRMHTFIPQSLEIEQYGGIGRVHADANLVTGPDPVDGSSSAHVPAGGSPLFVDWSDLGGALAEHRYLDASGLTGTRLADGDTFGANGEACIGPRTIAPSNDLTYVAIANNYRFAYLAAQRADNAVDSDVVFLFTQKRPDILAWTPCRTASKTIRFTLTAGTDAGDADVLLVGHFVARSAPLFRAYIAGRPGAHLAPAQVLDTTARWVEVDAIAAAAGNVTRTAPGSFGVLGVATTAADATSMAPGLFVELAVPMNLFAKHPYGNRTHYLTVMSLDRYAADGAVPVDLAGPLVIDMAVPKLSFPEPPLANPWLAPENPAPPAYQGE